MKIHLAVLEPQRGDPFTALCGANSDGSNSTDLQEAVTCRACLRIQKGQSSWRYRRFIEPPSQASAGGVETYPDHTFENAARTTGGNVRSLWQMRGPAGTGIAWIEAFSVNGVVAIVQTYEIGGWGVFTPSPSDDAEEIIEDALSRCGCPGIRSSR